MGEKSSTNGIPQFNGGGFDIWQYRVKIHLESLGLVDMLTSDPPTEEARRVEFIKKDVRARDCLVSYIADNFIKYVQDQSTCKAMWDNLESNFTKKSSINC